jgi:hypothetical protein
MIKRLVLVVFFALILAACGRETAAPTITVPTEIVPISLVETHTPEATSTETATATPEPSATPTTVPTATPEPRGYGPDNFPDNVNPLTGLEVADSSLLERRPIGVKVNIVPRYTRPPWGISLADIVYDYYHNDGYSRYHAIFYGQDAELVGPIRSGRLLDDAIVRMYKSIFAYGGADQIINNRLFNASYSNRLILEGTRALCPPVSKTPLCRYEPGKSDFLLGSTSALSEYISEKGIENGRQNLDGMTFHPRLPENGQSGKELVIRFSIDNYNRWKYDEDSSRYLLFQDALFLDQGQDEKFEPLTDRLTEKQIGADNVVILFATHEYVQRPPADIIEITLNGTGQAYAFRDGQAYKVFWNRPTPDSVLYLTFTDGSNYSFKPGQTWFQVVGQYSEVAEPEEGSWRFMFRLP